MSLNVVRDCSVLLRQTGSAPELLLALIHIELVGHLNSMKSWAAEIKFGEFLLNPAIGGEDESC